MNETLRVLQSHRSIRRFRDTPVPREVVERCVRAAQQAPTSSWVEAYSLLQVTDVEEREQLRELTGGQAQVAEAGAFFVISAETRRHELVAGREQVECAKNLETFLVAVIDASLFAQNLICAFESEGHGTCCIGGLRSRIAEVDELLELPEYVFPLFGLCVGEADEDPGTRPRFDLPGVLYEGRYPTDEALLEAIDAHDTDAAHYYAQRDQPGRSWTGALLRKAVHAEREHLAEYYRSKGARLE